MSREPSPEQKRALKIWLKSGRTKQPKEIAEEIGVSAALVRKWKSLGKWERLPEKRGRGAQPGNKNSKGNKGGDGGPFGNEKNLKHGLYRKFLPDDPAYMEVFDSTDEISPIDMLWTSIRVLWTNIMWSQRIMHVTDKAEMIKELKKRKYEVHSQFDKKAGQDKLKKVPVEEEYEFQFAWDRQATALNAQSQAMDRLAKKIKQYEDMLRSIPPAKVKEEQRLRVEKLKAEVDLVKAEAKKAGASGEKTGLRLEVDYGDDVT